MSMVLIKQYGPTYQIRPLVFPLVNSYHVILQNVCDIINSVVMAGKDSRNIE